MEGSLFPPPRPAYRPGVETAKVVWSYSRAESSRQCLARYYYEYFGSSASKALHDPEKQRLKSLKKLTNCALRVGDILHQSISGYLNGVRRGAVQTEAEIRGRALNRFERDIAYSSRCDDSVSLLPFDPIAQALLLEYYYGLDDAQAQAERMLGRLGQAITNFFTLEAFAHFHHPSLLKDALIEKEFKVRGELSVRGRVDLIYFTEDGVTICDWKIGEPEHTEDDLQLLTYALLVHKTLDVAPEHIDLQRIHLADGEVTRFTASRTDVERARHRILQDTRRLSMLEARGRAGQRDIFGPVDSLATCRLCPYQGVCPKGAA